MDCVADAIKFLKERYPNLDPRLVSDLGKQLDSVAKETPLPAAEFRAKAEAMLEDLFAEYAEKYKDEGRLQLNVLRQDVKALTEAKSRGSSVAETFTALMHGGGTKPGLGVNLPIRSDQRYYQQTFQTMFARAVEPYRGLLADGGDFRLEVFRAKDALDQDLGKPDNVTEQAWQLAKEINTIQEFVWALKKADNVWLTRADRYLFERIWDNGKIAGVPKEEFLKDAATHMSTKSFHGATPEQKSALFGMTYDQMMTGDYGTPRGMEWTDAYLDEPAPGEGSITKRMARSRVWQMDSADSAYWMNEKYGYGTLEQTIMRSLSKAAHDIPIVQRFTSKPEQYFDKLKEYAIKAAKEDGQPLTNGNIAEAQNAFDHATRSNFDEVTHWSGKVADVISNIEYLAHTKNLLLRHAPGASWTASLLSSTNGKGYLDNLGDLSSMVLKVAKASKDERRFLQEMGIFLGVYNANFQEGLVKAPSPAMLDRWAATYSKINLADWGLSASRSGIAAVVSKNLAEVSKLNWGTLAKGWHDGLARYGITELEHRFLLGAGIENLGKRLGPAWNFDAVTPQAINQIPLETIEAYLKKRDGVKTKVPEEVLRRERFKFSAKVSSMMRDHAEMGTGTPSQAQGAFIYRLENLLSPEGGKNSLQGSALGLALQFKMASLRQANTIKRLWHSSGGDKNAGKLLAQGFVGAAFISLLTYELQDALERKTPEAPWSPHRAAQALLHGSGVGYTMETFMHGLVAGDIPGELGKSLIGPGLSDIGRFSYRGYKLATAKEGHLTDVARRRLFELALQTVPFNSTLWSFDAYNQLVVEAMGNFWQDGYGQHLEQSMGKRPDIFGGQQHRYLFGGEQ